MLAVRMLVLKLTRFNDHVTVLGRVDPLYQTSECQLHSTARQAPVSIGFCSLCSLSLFGNNAERMSGSLLSV